MKNRNIPFSCRTVNRGNNYLNNLLDEVGADVHMISHYITSLSYSIIYIPYKITALLLHKVLIMPED